MNLQHLQKLLSEHNITTSKKLDQHFLYDREILQREAEYALLSPEDTVLEIGPGVGTLTSELSKRVRKVISIEKDPQFKPLLEKFANVEIIIADALKTDFPECNKIVSNIPYSISSPLTFKILNETNVELAVICYQKEFADRMVAQPGTRNYSRLSVNCAVRANVEIIETVPKSKYYPAPKVDSAIVRLIPKKTNLPKKFDDITRALFQHKNKKVRNALMDSYHEIGTEEEVKKFVDKLGEIAQIKVKMLTPMEIIGISNNF